MDYIKKYIKRVLNKLNEVLDKETRQALVKPVLIFIISSLILLGIAIVYRIYCEYKELEYKEFCERINLVRNKVIEFSEKDEELIGINITQIDQSEQYIKCNKSIPKIQKKYSTNLKSGEYYFIANDDKGKLGINEIIGEYIVNYNTTEVYSIKPVRYKGEVYYTIPQIEYFAKNIIDYRYPYIPKGFKYSEGEWNTGFVIKDEHENEFVWIPVGYLNEESPSSVLKKYYRDYDLETYRTDEYIGILNSIDKYKGFYVGRYEASLQGADDIKAEGNNNKLQVVKNVLPVSQMSFSTNSKNGVVYLESNNCVGYNENGKLTKKQKYIESYDEIPEENEDNAIEKVKIVSVIDENVKGALELARGMSLNYEWGEKGTYSALIYGEQFDTILKIIDELGFLKQRIVEGQDPIKEDSTLLGNYLNTKMIYKQGEEQIIKEPMQAELLPTGINLINGEDGVGKNANMIFNIYDLAGNLGEWTMDTQLGKYVSIRGGSFSNRGNLPPISEYVKQLPKEGSKNIGIRVVLYMN